MRKNILIYAISGVVSALSINALADEATIPVADTATTVAATPATAAPASPWTVTANINLVSDYYFRGISQTWHKPAAQGGFDVAHSSGAYAGMWFSNVSEDSYPGGGLEADYYFGYNGTFGEAVKDLGWTVGGYGYYYPGASYSNSVPSGANEDFNTFEVNAGLSYNLNVA